MLCPYFRGSTIRSFTVLNLPQSDTSVACSCIDSCSCFCFATGLPTRVRGRWGRGRPSEGLLHSQSECDPYSKETYIYIYIYIYMQYWHLNSDFFNSMNYGLLSYSCRTSLEYSKGHKQNSVHAGME